MGSAHEQPDFRDFEGNILVSFSSQITAGSPLEAEYWALLVGLLGGKKGLQKKKKVIERHFTIITETLQ